MIRGRSRIIGTLTRRVRACSGFPTDSHNHMAKAIWVAQELKLHRQLPQRRYAISGAIFGFSRSVFYIKANPAVSRKFPGRFPSVPRTALWPFLKFPCGNWWTKRKGRFQPLPSYLPARM
ncbi:hypothetical protein BFI45_15980 (plasmid) [Yersinia pestis subsp. microtus bv. Altaica]|uniref:Uncharacterized protein n=7 Tax=Yersinia pestis TaxID=632 RepID=A0A5P8YLZ1_YERPE|nr:unknown [Yersinia pestis KIM10+]ANW16653.1 hypothetical protein BAY22_22005 [Yersinia pestis]EIR10351.1 hypothetical protein YPPY04_4830 [Yersinia pestis PY-04]EIR25588.1 hypothetical protein YPPY10_4841 [Yersinia pestis PY-10]KJG85700.1 hypothetical protein RN23_08585 [Yersinia pestis subsp. microtus bv. Ulegeica]KKM47495.1 hypothetical protein KD37_22905 [Yersinia pestis subsp. pestis bv. Orientalis]KPD38472.1 hypothetical protein AC473_20965 [Yersinia pestis subsp. microtus bv. Caucasic